VLHERSIFGQCFNASSQFHGSGVIELHHTERINFDSLPREDRLEQKGNPHSCVAMNKAGLGSSDIARLEDSRKLMMNFPI
jgi:hypothetical protein